MEKSVTLKDGKDVLIRPMNRDDLEKSFVCFTDLPEEDRVFLRVDVSKRENVERRIQWMEQGRVKRLVAVVDDGIVADGTLELEEHDVSQFAQVRILGHSLLGRAGMNCNCTKDACKHGTNHETSHYVFLRIRVVGR